MDLFNEPSIDRGNNYSNLYSWDSKSGLKITDEENRITQVIKFLTRKSYSVVLYGAGVCGKATMDLLREHKVNVWAICDDDQKRQGEPVGDLKISRIEDIIPEKNLIIFITSGFIQKMKEKLERLNLLAYYKEIDFGRYEENCENRDFFLRHEKDLLAAYLLLSDQRSKEIFCRLVNYRISRNLLHLKGCEEENQYFPEGLFQLDENEVFLDVGAYDGDSILSFLTNANGKYKKIIALEPSYYNYKRLVDNMKSIVHVECYNVGAYKESAKLKFSVSEAKNSFISESGDKLLEVAAIDQLLENEEVTFIKMDIEGAEYDALLGAERMISKRHPILAISIYHKVEDLFQLPLLINRIAQGYRYYIRHYSPTAIETILYAVPEYK